LQELTRLRRFVEDWRLLGLCYLEQGQPRKALPALEQALAIRPFRPDVHAALAAAYLRLGDRQHAREHQEMAKWLAEHSQQ
jgi:Tfp pilus assembly protein PilF